MHSILASHLEHAIKTLLRAYRLSPTHATLCANHIVTNDRRGIHTHGTRRLPNYLDRIAAGAIQSRAKIQIIKRHHATVWLDGHHAMGQVTAHYATQMLIRRAPRYGIACVGAQNCEHIGALDAYIRTIVAHQLVGIIMCNTPVAMAPLSGTQALIGSNPLAIGIPGIDTPIMVFDGSTAATSRGKLLTAAASDTPIPAGVAIDTHGQPTRDAKAALAGALLPAGPLGYGIGLAIGLMSGAMVGGVADPQLPSFFETPHQPTSTSVVMIAIDPEAFGGQAQLQQVGQSWLDQIRQSHGNPRIPGDRRQLKEHITLPDTLIEQLNQYALAKRISIW